MLQIKKEKKKVEKRNLLIGEQTMLTGLKKSLKK